MIANDELHMLSVIIGKMADGYTADEARRIYRVRSDHFRRLINRNLRPIVEEYGTAYPVALKKVP